MSTVEGSGRFVNDNLAYYVDFSNKKSFPPNLVNYSVWKVGIGSISANSLLYGGSGFSLNGSGDENVRVLENDPFGNTQSIIWKGNSALGDGTDGRVVSGATVSPGDGGWNGSIFPIDRTKMYRFSVWTKRDAMTIGTHSGSFYLGLFVYGSGSGLLQQMWSKSGGLTASNAYFHITSDPYPSTTAHISPPFLGGLNVWTLVVGHVWPFGTPTASLVAGSNINGLSLNYSHPDSGVWTRASGKIGNLSIGDWIWSPTASHSLLRTYLFYSADTTATQSFVYPRVDVIDGTEPSISELLKGPEPVRDLVNSNDEHGFNTIYPTPSNFSPEGNGCLSFSASKQDNIQGTISTTFSMYSASVWFNSNIDSTPTSTGNALFQIRNSSTNNSTNRLDLYLGNVTGAVTNEVITFASGFSERTAVTDITIPKNTWNNIILNWESTSYAVYLNGVKQTTTSGTSTNVALNTYVDYLVIGARVDPDVGLGSFFGGKISSLAMWKKTLSTSEILRIYTNGKTRLGI